MSGILMGIHFGDSFMYALYSWMVNGKRKILEHMFSFSTFMARIIWDRSLSFLTMLSWVLGDYYFYYYSIRIIGKILLFVSKCFLSIFLYFSTICSFTQEKIFHWRQTSYSHLYSTICFLYTVILQTFNFLIKISELHSEL